MDVRTDPLKMGMGGVALMGDAPGAIIWGWGVIPLPKRMASVGFIDQIEYVAAQQVAPTYHKGMEFARHMVEVEVAQSMVVQRIYFSPECAIVITKTRLFALKSMLMQWEGKRSHRHWIVQSI
jgi:hypothetical protein